MKLKFKINGKTVEKETRNLLHFEIQKKTRANVFKNKKKYTRKKKYRDKNEDRNSE